MISAPAPYGGCGIQHISMTTESIGSIFTGFLNIITEIWDGLTPQVILQLSALISLGILMSYSVKWLGVISRDLH